MEVYNIESYEKYVVAQFQKDYDKQTLNVWRGKIVIYAQDLRILRS